MEEMEEETRERHPGSTEVSVRGSERARETKTQRHQQVPRRPWQGLQRAETRARLWGEEDIEGRP